MYCQKSKKNRFWISEVKNKVSHNFTSYRGEKKTVKSMDFRPFMGGPITPFYLVTGPIL